MMGSLREAMGWSSLGQFIRTLETNGELLRVSHPVDLRFEAGCIADRLVKMGGPAVVFDQPRLADGSISSFPMAMQSDKVAMEGTWASEAGHFYGTKEVLQGTLSASQDRGP